MTEQIAIIIPWYNKLQYAQATLDSIRSQISNDWHCIIHDDASHDGARDFLLKETRSDPRFTLILNNGPRGIIQGFHRCMTLAGQMGFDIVGMMDCDDTLHPTAVDEVLKFYSEPPYKEFVYTQFFFCDHNLVCTQGPGFSATVKDGNSFFDGGCIGHWKTFGLSAYERLPHPMNPAFDHASDKELAFRLEEVTKPWFLNKMLYYWRGWAVGSITNDPHLRSITSGNAHHSEQSARARRSNWPSNWVQLRDAAMPK